MISFRNKQEERTDREDGEDHEEVRRKGRSAQVSAAERIDKKRVDFRGHFFNLSRSFPFSSVREGQGRGVGTSAVCGKKKIFDVCPSARLFSTQRRRGRSWADDDGEEKRKERSNYRERKREERKKPGEKKRVPGNPSCSSSSSCRKIFQERHFKAPPWLPREGI